MSGYDASRERWEQQRAIADGRWKQRVATQNAQWDARMKAMDARFDAMEQRMTDSIDRALREAFTNRTPWLVLSQVGATFAMAALAFALIG